MRRGWTWRAKKPLPQGLKSLRENLKGAPSLVGALCFSRGEQRFSVAEKGWTLTMRFSAGLENPGLKPVLSE